MSKKSAGLLLFRETGGAMEVLLVHPGGPFWVKKDDGAWSIPKGEIAGDEEPLAAAKREFEEEMGAPAGGDFIALDALKQPGGKMVLAVIGAAFLALTGVCMILALALLTNTVVASDDPGTSMHTISLAVADAVVLEGPRGEAAETAAALIETLAGIG